MQNQAISIVFDRERAVSYFDRERAAGYDEILAKFAPLMDALYLLFDSLGACRLYSAKLNDIETNSCRSANSAAARLQREFAERPNIRSSGLPS
jgi:hypothetical protein